MTDGRKIRLLVLLTDAYGAGGGIAKFNRDMLSSLAAHSGVKRITALPRLAGEPTGSVPLGVDYRTEGAGGKVGYAVAVVGETIRGGHDGVVCGHMHLLPLAWIAARRASVPLILVVHGIEAWTRSGSRIANRLVDKIDTVVSVSETTKRRFRAWSELPDERFVVIPNCVEARAFGPGPKRPDLLARYGLEDRTVLLTLGRLSSAERYKGIDEVLEALPSLARDTSDLAYLVVGDGDDRPRLERKAARLGLSDRVVFAGRVAEAEKADHYRLADAFVMPGRGEGFGIVYLEAMACGVPVVASNADGSREAVLDGALGIVIDPDDPDALKAGILRALGGDRGRVPEGLEHFSFESYRQRWRRVVDRVFDLEATAAGGPPAMAAGREIEA